VTGTRRRVTSAVFGRTSSRRIGWSGRESHWKWSCKTRSHFPPITYYWTGFLILDHSYLVGNLTNSKIAETKALESLKSWHFCISNFWTC
jgi:hypothetical protein